MDAQVMRVRSEIPVVLEYVRAAVFATPGEALARSVGVRPAPVRATTWRFSQFAERQPVRRALASRF
jgi:hypothetical protein